MAKQPAKVLSPAAIAYLEGEAADRLANFEGDTSNAKDDVERERLSYGAAYEELINTYAALREHAARQMTDFFNDLHWFGDQPRDAFYAKAILFATRDRLKLMIERDKEMEQALKAAETENPKPTFGNKKRDADIARSAQSESGFTDGDVAESAWGTRNIDRLDDKIADSGRDNTYAIGDESKGDDDGARSSSVRPVVPDLFKLAPRECFKAATACLAQGVLWHIAEDGGGRIAPLIREYELITRKEIDKIAREIGLLTSRLTPPAQDKADELH